MAIPSPQTALSNAVVKASNWNTDVRDAINFFLGGGAPNGTTKPSFSATMGTTGQSIPTTVWTSVLLPNVLEDTSNGYDQTTGTYTATVAGFYSFVASIAYASDSGGSRFIQLVSTGTPSSAYNSTYAPSDAFGRVTCYLQTILAVGQSVTFQTYNGSGGTLLTQNSSSTIGIPGFAGHWVSL